MKIRGFLGLWIGAALLAGCISPFNAIVGSGKMVSETREVSGFDTVALSGVGDLTIIQGDKEGLTIQAEDNLLPELTSEVRGSTLYLQTRNWVNVMPTKGIQYTLHVKNLRGVNISGSGSVSADRLVTAGLNVNLSGSGRGNLSQVDAQSLDVRISGSGRFDLSGQVDSLDISISGSGKFDAGELQTRQAQVIISGSGSATLWVEDNLSARISGSGRISYYGSPTISQSVSGSGSMTSLGIK